MIRAESQLYRSQEGETFCQRIVKAANIRPNKVAMMLIEPEGNKAITFGSMLARIRSIAAYHKVTSELKDGFNIYFMKVAGPAMTVASMKRKIIVILPAR